MKLVKVIAEVGSTWYRPNDPVASKQAALDSVLTAAGGGADIVKFQLGLGGLWSRERAPAQWEACQQLDLPLDWLLPLRAEADRARVELWASVFTIDVVRNSLALELLDGIKMASGELGEGSKPLLIEAAKQAARIRVPLAISTGTHTGEEVERALFWLEEFGLRKLVLMNCVSKYPATPDDYQLEWPLKYRGQVLLGLSDHTLDNHLPNFSVKVGYVYFEKHFKLPDTPIDNPDFGHSLDPGQFANYVRAVRKADQQYLGILKRVAPGEEGEQVWMQRGTDGRRPKDA